MDIFLMVVAGILLIVGIIGCIVPGLPGVLLSYVGLLLAQLTDKIQWSWQFLLIWGMVTIMVTVLDYVVPAQGTKKYGGSKWGVWGSTIGLFVGMFMGPWGIVIGPFVGAVLGELIGGKETKEALKAGWGSFMGLLFSTIVKLVCCGMMVYYFVVAVV